MQQFGRFFLHGRIARGGMCDVFRVRTADGEPHSGDLVLKCLMPQMDRHPAALRMFINEGEIGATLRHPNLVRVYEQGVLEGRHYLLMEHVHGLDLSALIHQSRLREHPVPWGMSIHIICQVLSGLEYAHFATRADGQPLGLIHRDVSPDNIYCTVEGAVKLGDFGIAKFSALEPFTDPRMGIRGKLLYMAPERIRGEIHDGRSDTFSAAILLYELLAGTQPYAAREGESLYALSQRIARAEIPRLRKVAPDISKKLDAVVMKSLEAEPSSRHPTCQAFAAELLDVARSDRLVATPADVAALVAALMR